MKMQVEDFSLTLSCSKEEEDKVETHRRILNKLLDNDNDSCCDICQCDCYNSLRDSGAYSYCDECDEFDGVFVQNVSKEKNKKCEINAKTTLKNTKKWLKSINTNTSTQSIPTTTSTKRKRRRSLSLPRHKHDSKPSTKTTTKLVNHHSKSASNLHSHPYLNTRDCEIFKNNTPLGKGLQIYKQRKALPLQKCQLKGKESVIPLNLCASMSSLCLEQQQLKVRKAFEQISEHDQKIINCMAAKRSQEIAAKENAWLARRFWENERYERELLKYEQMEEFQRAMRDKQFQNYLLTKSRLEELEQRDHAQMQRLRESLQNKDTLLHKRLTSINLERELKQQEKRCDEIRKLEAINIQQVEQQLEEQMRRKNSCNRLQERLEQANIKKKEILAAHLKRLSYDNNIAQIAHEENWKETFKQKETKKQQLMNEIVEKSRRTQQFTKQRDKRNEALAQTAKLSASLRELVRTSVLPESLTIFN